MSSEIDIIPERFVTGRDTYVERVPFFEMLARVASIREEIAEQNKTKPAKDHVDVEPHIFSFAAGFFDGLLNDIREAADWAREERKRSDA